MSPSFNRFLSLSLALTSATLALATPTRTLTARQSASDIADYLSDHNTVREQHGAVDLVWNDTLASAAQTWANNCVFEHSGGSLGPYGGALRLDQATKSEYS